MNEIWANRLVAGTKVWAEVSDFRRNAVKEVLRGRVEKKIITEADYQKITGDAFGEYGQD